MNGVSMKGANHFNIIGTRLGGKYKIAHVLFYTDENLSNEWNIQEKNEAEANATLIASAPQLLEALIFLTNEADGCNKGKHDFDDNAIFKAKRAINKALGK